ncbi:MAG: RHS repeat-associated core domain-containing protein [Acutalibacteraceae bacterium]
MIAIYNTDGDLQCKYNYDAWGNHRIGNARNELIYDSATGVIATGYENHIAILNPIRYRGYYYDIETGLYYLQSRYYDATLCRFLNRDNVNYLEPESIHGLNLYAYCNNNPVMFADPSGHSVILAMLIGAGIGLVIGLGSQLASDIISNVVANGFDLSEWKMSSWQTYVGVELGGVIGGALTPFLGPVVTGFITGASSTAISMGLSNVTGVSNYSLGEIICTSLLIGAVSSITTGILDNVKIPGVNSGRGSLTAVSKQINTKLVNGSIKNVSIKTIGKMATLNAIYSAPFTIFNGLFTNGIVLSPAC